MEGKNKHISFLFILREQLSQIIRNILSLKVLVILIITGIMVVEYWDGYHKGDSSQPLVMVSFAGIWILFLFPFLSKQLITLLPMNEKEKKIYLWQYLVGRLLWIYVFFFFIGGAASVLWHLKFAPWMLSMITGFPILFADNTALMVGRNNACFSSIFDNSPVCEKTENIKERTGEVLFGVLVVVVDFAPVYSRMIIDSMPVFWGIWGIATVLSVLYAIKLIQRFYRSCFSSENQNLSRQEG